MQALGRHILVELFGCSVETLNDVVAIEAAMIEAAKRANATVLQSAFHHFSPYGVSGVVVIQESHLAIHTWPEFQYAAVDIFTCGDSVNPWTAYDHLRQLLGAANGSAMEIRRGQTELLERVAVAYLHRYRPPAAAVFQREVWFTDKNKDTAISLRHTGEILYRHRSPYQRVQVLQTEQYGKLLALDDMIIATEKDEYIYHEMLVHPAMLVHPCPQRVLVIGGGDGGTAREVLRHASVEHVDLVEIDACVPEACRLHLPQLACQLDHPHLHLHIADAADFIKGCSTGYYDIILMDIAAAVGPAEPLHQTDFYAALWKCLATDGILVAHGDSPFTEAEALAQRIQHWKKGAKGVDPKLYWAHIPTYLSGSCAFIWLSRARDPLTALNDATADNFAERQNLQYYSAAIHRAAFVLPLSLLSRKSQVSSRKKP